MSALQPLNVLGMPLAGTQLIEASAGTGKTWTIAALYVRLVLGHGRDAPLLPNQILVMTFTKAATAELRERIRSRLTEAAAAFRSDGTGDDFLRDLVAHYPAGNARAGAARRLDLAAQWMDEAAIFTIHGWCQRMLTQHAFASGDTVADGGIADAAALRIEAVRDYWRCCVAPLADDGVAWVAQWWQSPDDLAAAVKPLLPLPVAGLRLGDAGIPPIADASAFIATRAAALHAASATARTAWRDDADTIDALLTNAVQARTLSATKLPLTSLPGCLAAMRDWANGADAPVELLRRFTQPAIDGAANKGKAAPGHPAFAALQRLVEAGAAGTVDYPRLLAHAAHWIAAHEDAARRAQGTLGYDDMLQRLANALDDDHGEALAQRIVAQYPVALVDEFQDTDPLQWHSLERVYVDRPGATLCLIGDPKQAIYGFRGADIQTYLHARERAALPWWTLPVNFRSTTALVAAVNRVFLHASTQPQGAFGFDD
ncbi:MAG TPA: UvrD-helicase domain-containing protein, partial [Rhodanobacter sp.]|nr:UvrD-helicase domain-containing protein [Rhodanobacter sp.]